VKSPSCPEPILPAPLAGARSESMAFAVSDRLVRDAALFTDQTVVSWALTDLRVVVAETTAEFVFWLLAHEPSAVVRVAVTWDGSLVHVELFDRGQIIPDTHASCTDAAFAVHVLIRPGVQWGGSVDARGRCLWATVDASAQEGFQPASPTETGP
jgi:hypothetical protein